MTQDIGASAEADRATHEPSPSVSALRVGIPSATALWQAMQDPEVRRAYNDELLADSLGFQIRQLRRQRRLTVEQLAELADCCVLDIIACEDGDCDTDLDFLQRLASVFDVALVATFVPFSQIVRDSVLPTFADETAQGIEAGTGETGTGSIAEGDESPVGEAEAPKG